MGEGRQFSKKTCMVRLYLSRLMTWAAKTLHRKPNMASHITEILQRVAQGQPRAVDELIPVVYEQMREIASRVSHRESPAALMPTELVHEAYIRLVGNEKLAWESRAHFFAAAATVIRRILVDDARGRKRKKRGGDVRPQPLETNMLPIHENSVDLLALDEALEQLAQLSPRQAKLVELRFFGGFSQPQIAEMLQVSTRTVANDWAMARVWLKSRLT